MELIRFRRVVGVDDHAPVRLGFADLLLIRMRPGLPFNLQFAYVMERKSEQHGPLKLVGSQPEVGDLS